MTAVAMFFAANAAFAWSQSMVSLIIYRTIGGIAGGGMTRLSFVIVADLFPVCMSSHVDYHLQTLPKTKMNAQDSREY